MGGVFHVFGVFDEWSVITHDLNNVDTSFIGKIVATVRPTVAPSLLPSVSITASLFQQHHVTSLHERGAMNTVSKRLSVGRWTMDMID